LKKVLIIDDSVVWRTYLQNLLELHGHTTEIAKDGLEGLNKFFIFLPDVVIVDYVMPRLNGVHFTRFVRSFSTFKNVGILMLTGAEETINQFWARKSGANAFLKKTESQAEIEKAILSFVSGSYSMEWSREIYKLHIEPYGELVDILEESLKESTITKEILELTNLIYDEKLIMQRLYELFRELLDFENIYFCLLTYSGGRLYAFGNGQLADSNKILEMLQNNGIFQYFEYAEQLYSGVNREIKDHVAEILTKGDNVVGFVLIENPKLADVAMHMLALASYSLAQLFDLLNWYKITGNQKEFDDVSGAYNIHVVSLKIANAIDFAERNDLPVSFIKLRIKDLWRLYKTLGVTKANSVIKKLVEEASVVLSSEIGRISLNTFIITLLGKQKDQALQNLEHLKDRLSKSLPELSSEGIQINYSIIEWSGQTVGEILQTA